MSTGIISLLPQFPNVERVIVSAGTLQGYQQASIHLHNLYIKNFDIFLWLLLVHSRILDLVNHIQTLNSSPKYRMLVVKPRLY